MSGNVNSYLSVWDYVIIAGALLLSAGLGLYNGCLKTKQSSFFEYFLGSQSIGIFPLAISSFSTITASGLMIGVVFFLNRYSFCYTSEVYYYGIGVILVVIPYFLIIPIMNHFVTPVFRKFSSGNIFEFFEIRYNVTFKAVVTSLYIFASINFASMTIYGPSIAISLVMKQNIWVVVSVMMVICMIYTIFGGMRAVVIADTVQGLQMLVCMIILVICGTLNIGGMSKIWETSSEGKRLELDFSLDLSVTHTVWSTLIGWLFSYVCFFALNQPNIQRLLACSTLKQAQTINNVSVIMLALSIILMTYLSLLAYATFAKCDPIMNNEIKSMNQIFPYYIMKTFVKYPGLPGLYFSGLVAASLSTLSSFINSLACVSIDTFIISKYPNMSEVARTNTCKLLAFLYGGLTVLAVLFIELFPNIMQGGTLTIASVSCPLFALFVVGVCCPRANNKGGIIAFTLSFSFGIWLIIGVLLYPSSITHIKPSNIEGCPVENMTVSTSHFFNHTSENALNINVIQRNNITSTNSSDYMKGAFPLAGISYLWIGGITFWLALILSILFTYILGKNEVNEKFLEYIPPIIQRFHNRLSTKQKEWFLCDVPQTHKKENLQQEECVPLSQTSTMPL